MDCTEQKLSDHIWVLNKNKMDSKMASFRVV